MTAVHDPGWSPSIRALPRLLLPVLGAHKALRDTNGLVVLRSLWLLFLSSVLLIGAVVLAMSTLDLGTGPDGRAVAVGVAAIGVIAQLVAPVLVPGIRGDTAGEAVASVQRSVLARVAFAEVAPLAGFVGFMISVNPAVFLVGAAIGVAGLLDAMPSGERVVAWQQELRDSGSSVELLPALVSTGISR